MTGNLSQIFWIAAVSACLTIWPTNSHAKDWEFGQIRLGEIQAKPLADVRATKDCLNKRIVMTCLMKLDDNVWYGFDRDSRLDIKSVYNIQHSGPSWINHRDGVQECKRRLEVVIGQKFDIHPQENGDVHLAIRDSIRSEIGYYFRIFVIFRRGLMIELTISLEPHEDV